MWDVEFHGRHNGQRLVFQRQARKGRKRIMCMHLVIVLRGKIDVGQSEQQLSVGGQLSLSHARAFQKAAASILPRAAATRSVPCYFALSSLLHLKRIHK